MFFFGFSYIFLVVLIFLNLFIAIILTGYLEITEREKQVLNSNLLEHFRDSWARVDPDATGKIPNDKFEELMFLLGEPIGWDEGEYKDDF